MTFGHMPAFLNGFHWVKIFVHNQIGNKCQSAGNNDSRNYKHNKTHDYQRSYN